ncbi:MAG: hypothetical protein V1859_09690 [archaeon]
MLFIPHIIIGLAVGKFIHPLLLIAIISILSHFALDALPHWDIVLNKPDGQRMNLKTWKRQPLITKEKVFLLTLIQLILTLIVALIIKGENRVQALVVGGFFGIFPDLLDWILVFFNLPSIHFFKHKHISLLPGLLLQVSISLLGLYIIIAM